MKVGDKVFVEIKGVDIIGSYPEARYYHAILKKLNKASAWVQVVNLPKQPTIKKKLTCIKTRDQIDLKDIENPIKKIIEQVDLEELKLKNEDKQDQFALTGATEDDETKIIEVREDADTVIIEEKTTTDE